MSVQKKNLTVRVPVDTYEEFEDYREERGNISKADAGRRLLEEGLDAETETESDEERPTAPGLFAEAAASFAGSATLVAVLATIVWFVSPALLDALIVGSFWMVAGVSNAFTIVGARRGWFGGGGSNGGE
jgi:hypothetical protein